MFAIKIFAMKYKIEVPILNIRNTFPPDDKNIQFQIHDLQLFILKGDGDHEIIKKENYDLNELQERFNFLLVIYNNLSMNEEKNEIDTSIDNKFNGIHLKMVYFKKKMYLEDIIGTPEQEEPIDPNQIININEQTNTNNNLPESINDENIISIDKNNPEGIDINDPRNTLDDKSVSDLKEVTQSQLSNKGSDNLAGKIQIR